MGEGEYNIISVTYTPLPFIPSHQERGNLTFTDVSIFSGLVIFRH